MRHTTTHNPHATLGHKHSTLQDSRRPGYTVLDGSLKETKQRRLATGVFERSKSRMASKLLDHALPSGSPSFLNFPSALNDRAKSRTRKHRYTPVLWARRLHAVCLHGEGAELAHRATTQRAKAVESTTGAIQFGFVLRRDARRTATRLKAHLAVPKAVTEPRFERHLLK